MKQAEKLHTVSVRTDTVKEGKLTLTYTLLYRESLHTPHRAPFYSIRAELQGADGKCEMREITDAFIDPGHALIFYELCRTHRVLPVHLCEVREDFED